MSFDTIMHDPDLSRIARELEALKRNAIRIQATVVDEQMLPIGASKLGGLPDLPPDIPWPTTVLNVPPPSPAFIATRPDQPLLPPGGRIALPFIAQIRTSDVAPYDLDKLLPPSGMLYFFHNTVAYFSDTGAVNHVHDTLHGYSYGLYDWGTPANWRVFFYDGDVKDLRRTPVPATVPEDVRYRACALTFATEETLPSVETCYIGDRGSAEGRLVLTPEEWEIYADLRYEERANLSIHQVLGYSDDVQPAAMENRYRSVRAQFFPELPPYERLSPAEKQQELEGGRLLLQVDEEDNGMYFGRDGRLFFFIRETDLARRDFSRVWVTEQ